MTDTLSSSTHIGSVYLYARNPASLASFYQHSLGLDLLGEAGDTLLLGVGGQPMIGIQPATQQQASGRRTGLFHLALRYATRLALARAFRRLVTLRTALQGASDHGVSESIYLTDPEGNGIELYWDRQPELWPRAADGSLQLITNTLDLEQLLAEDLAYTSRPHVDPHTRMGHIHLNVGEIPASEKFYVEMLGFDVIQRFGKTALFISAGGYHHHIGLNTWQGTGAPPLPQGAPGLGWFEINGVNLDEIQRRLEKIGWDFQRSPGAGIRTCDPSGIGLVLLGY